MTEKMYQYRNSYLGIFSLNYLLQGITQGIFTITLPIYLLVTMGKVDVARLSIMFSIITLPFVFKVIWGISSDKLSKRKHFIVIPSIFCGILWMLIPLFLNLNHFHPLTLFTIIGAFMFTLFSIADAGLDGLINDICPKEKIGRTMGTIWATRSIGILLGGIVTLLLLDIIILEYILIVVGLITIIFSCLTILIKENRIKGDINKKKNSLMVILTKKENWKVFGWSFFMAIAAGVITIFFTLFALIKLGYVSPSSGSSIEVLQEDTTLYILQAYLSAIFVFGIIIGSLLGGMFADKISRRKCVLLAFIFSSTPLFLLLFSYPSHLWMIYWIFTFVLGAGTGWSFSALTSIISELSKKESMNLTFFTLCISFTNLGTSLGLFLAGQIFNLMSGTGNILVIYSTVFLFFAFFILIGLIPFLMIDDDLYECPSISKSESMKIHEVKIVS